MKWKFHDQPNTACFTTSQVIKGSPILRVYHDYDGDWQFHGSPKSSAHGNDAKLVSLQSIVDHDPSLSALYDLPYGWRAERKSLSSPWIRHKNHPYPTFAENGYYLEDAVWLSGYLPDIHPPPEEAREELGPNQLVKLIFRFAGEDAKRQNNQCERMWVRIDRRDQDGNYLGILDNDPIHDAISCGERLFFHPLHIAEIYDEDED